jgi:antitoxin component HigA of HigAB toxin-antitoxin module
MTAPLKKKQSNEQRYFDALKRIRHYMTPEQIRRDNLGLDYTEYLEMAYENIKLEAAHAIKNRKRPLQ